MAVLLSADHCTMRVLEDTLISPLQSLVLKPSNLPQTFLDIFWMGFHPVQRLFFYDFPYPSSHFIQYVLPNLKSYLSIALQRFFPLAGNLVLPPPPQMPYIQSKDGDYVRFIAKKSSSGRADFEYLIGDLSFLNKPEYNRDLINDPQGLLASKFMKDKWNLEDLDTISSSTTTSNKLQVTFVIKRSQVELLKNRIRTKSMEEENISDKLWISTFVVTYAYMWVCLNKLLEKSGTEDKYCHLAFLADCRHQLGLPETYFGNCIEPRFVTVKKSELMSGKGVVVAAKAIGREIMDFESGFPFKLSSDKRRIRK